MNVLKTCEGPAQIDLRREMAHQNPPDQSETFVVQHSRCQNTSFCPSGGFPFSTQKTVSIVAYVGCHYLRYGHSTATVPVTLECCDRHSSMWEYGSRPVISLVHLPSCHVSTYLHSFESAPYRNLTASNHDAVTKSAQPGSFPLRKTPSAFS